MCVDRQSVAVDVALLLALLLALVPLGSQRVGGAVQVELARSSPNSVWSVAWSPDGKRLASGSYDGLVRLWEETRRPRRSCQAIIERSPSCPGAPRVSVWPRQARTARYGCGTLGANRGLCSKDTAASSPASPGVRTANNSRLPASWTARCGCGPLTGNRSWCWRDIGIASMAWPGVRTAGNWRRQVTDGTVRLWTAEGRTGPVLEGGGGKVYSVGWRPDGKQLASANHDGTIRLWAADGTPTAMLRAHEGYVASVAWSPDGKRIASAGEDKTVRLWDVGGTRRLILKRHVDIAHSAVWSPDGAQLLSGGMDGLLCLWDARTAEVTRTRDLSRIQR